MTPKIVRYMIFSIAAGLMLAAMTACGGGGEEPTPEPEVDLQATIAARLANALPTDTPAPEPTDTPEPTAAPTPDLQATIAAAFEQTRAAMPPTPTPAPPTATPEPTPTFSSAAGHEHAGTRAGAHKHAGADEHAQPHGSGPVQRPSLASSPAK